MFARVRLGLQAKLLGGAALLLTAMAVVALVSISGLGSVDTVAKRLYTGSARPLAALANARAAARDDHALLSAHVIELDPKRMAAIERTMAADDAAIAKSLTAVAPTLDAKGLADLAEVRRELAAYVVARQRVLAVSRKINMKADPAVAVKRVMQASTMIADEANPPFAKAAAAFDRLFNAKVAAAAAGSRRVHATYTSKRSVILALVVLALAIGLVASLLFARSVRRAVGEVLATLTSLRSRCAAGLQEGLRALAQGDLTVEAHTVTPPIERIPNDEIGDVCREVNAIREAIDTSVTEYNAMRATLATMVGQISTSAGTVSSSSQEVAATAEEAGRAVGEIAGAVAEVANGAGQQTRSVDSAKQLSAHIAGITASSAGNATRTGEAADEASSAAQDGAAAVTEASDAMEAVRGSAAEATAAIRELGDKSEQIGGIVDTITGIAEQTNLLALNAAIEAARAGEQGRGFAVVAEEVRKLAEGSRAAAETIAGLVAQIQRETARAVAVVEDGARRTEAGVETVGRVRDAFDTIESKISVVRARVGEIASAVADIAAASGTMEGEIAQVAAVAEQSSASSQEVSASTEQTSASVQQIAASAQELAGTAVQLDQLVRAFKL